MCPYKQRQVDLLAFFATQTFGLLYVLLSARETLNDKFDKNLSVLCTAKAIEKEIGRRIRKNLIVCYEHFSGKRRFRWTC